MFDALRRMIVPIIIIVLVFFAGMIVLEWGLGLSGRQQFEEANVAGVVNGEEISWQQYNDLYSNMLQTEQQQSEEDLPEQRLRELQEAAWQQLVTSQILKQKVREYGIVVTEDELYSYLRNSPPQYLRSSPSFQTNGQFDYQKYLQAMANPQASGFWAMVESSARTELAQMKVQELVLQTAQVTETEVRNWFLATQESVKVNMINVGFQRFSRPLPTPTTEELETYFAENREDYHVDAQASLLLVLMEKEPQPADWEATHERAKAIYDSIQAGADFAELAEIYSEDPGSRSKGGDLGWFPRGQMVDQFDRYAFAMDEGQVSEPIRTQFGWHIIKVHGKRTQEQPVPGRDETEEVEQVHASHILIQAQPSQETLDQYYNRMAAFQDDAKEMGLSAAAEKHKLPVRQTEYFFEGRNVQYLGRDQRANEFAFSNEEGAVSDLLENNSAFYVAELADRRPAGPATFEQAKMQLTRDLQTEIVRNHCVDTAAVIWSEIRNGADFQQAARNHGEEVQSPDPFTRSAYVEGIRQDPMAIGAAFGLEQPGDRSGPVEYGQGVVIFELIERFTPDMSEYTEKRDSVYTAVKNRKQSDLANRWMQNLVKDADVVNNVAAAIQEGTLQ